ncbi:MAG: uracil phosphoribosyltransferase [Gelidibacter sp.]
MTEFFNGIGNLFTNVLLLPFDALMALELKNWWLANLVSWILIIIAMVGFVYWMLELKKHDNNKEEDKSVSSHSFL